MRSHNLAIIVLGFALRLALLGQESGGNSWVEVVEATRPSVVVIQTDQGQGSGFLVRDNGTIVTNHHVISESTRALIKLESGEKFRRVHVLVSDPSKDLAILRIESAGLPFLPLGDSNRARVGEEVILIGSPKGLEQTVSNGIVSGTRLTETGFEVIQTTAAASPGSSGGPLLDRRGQVIGVASFYIAEAQNLNFVIPINYVRGMLASLEAGLAGEPRLLQSTEEADLFSANRSPGVLLAGYGEPGESFSIVFLELMNFLAANSVLIANHPSTFQAVTGDSVSVHHQLKRVQDLGADYLLYVRVSNRMWEVSRAEVQCLDSSGNLLWSDKVRKTFANSLHGAARSLARKMMKKLKRRIG